MHNYKILSINRKEFLELERLYKKAVSLKKDIIVFKGDELVTGYVRYILEYLADKHSK